MTDDWEQFSANPYQQQPEQAGSGTGMSPVAAATYPFLIFDWPDQLSVVNAMLLGGKKGIWIDLLEAERMGLSGQDIQNELKCRGIEMHARALYPLDGTIAAIIVVDVEKEEKARKILADMGVLLL